MKEYSRENLRNVAVVGHGQVGKTSLLDVCLFKVGAANRIGRVDDKTSTLDTDPEEIKRHFSIACKLMSIEWHDKKINFLDTPGYPDFVGDVIGSMVAADCALLVLSASDGIEFGTESGWNVAKKLEKPRAFFINKMDRPHADFQGVLLNLREKFGDGVVAVQLPIGSAESFVGTVDVLAPKDPPADMADELHEAKQNLIEALADYNDELLEKFLNDEEISEEEIAAALKIGVAEGKVFPVFCGSAGIAKGMRQLLNNIVDFFPEPNQQPVMAMNTNTEELVEVDPDGPFSAQVFKTIIDPFVGRVSYLRVFSGNLSGDMSCFNPGKNVTERFSGLFTMQAGKQISLPKVCAGDIVATTKLADTKTGDTLCDKDNPVQFAPIDYPTPMLVMSATAEKKNEIDKVVMALEKEKDGDPTLQLVRNRETKELLIRAIGETQIDIVKEKLKRKYNLSAVFGEPKISLRETIRKSAEAEGKHKKQTGGHGQYGHVKLELSPKPSGEGNEFVDSIVGGVVPRQFIPAVEKGTNETLAAGILAGFPVVDVRVNLVFGSYHPVDSSEAAFKSATAIALKKAFSLASPVLLEPVFDVTVKAPEEFMGDVVGQLNARRAKIMGMDSEKGISVIKAKVPEMELYRYATILRAQTQGRGTFEAAFSHYDQMPERTAQDVINKMNEEKEAK